MIASVRWTSRPIVMWLVLIFVLFLFDLVYDVVRLIEADDKCRRFRLWLCVERVLGQLLALIERVEQSVADRTIVEEQPPAALRLAASGSYCHPLELQPSALGHISNLCSFKFHGSGRGSVGLLMLLDDLVEGFLYNGRTNRVFD